MEKLVKGRGLSRRQFAAQGAAGLVLASAAGRLFAQPAKDVIRFASLLDFTKVYTFISSEYSQGQRDYVNLVNAEGGIGGHPLRLTTKDHASEPQRGIALYNEALDDGAIFFDFLSTPVSVPMVPRVIKDKVPLITLFHGRGDSIDGEVFPYVFPAGPIYWSQAAYIIKHIDDHDGGIKGKKIGFVHIDSPFGREPIELLKSLAQKLEFQLELFPYASPGSEQSAAWTKVRRYKADKTIIWGGGPSQAVSVRTALSNGINVKDIYSVIWMSESDIESIGTKDAIGLKRFSAVNNGLDSPILKRIVEKVIEPGHGSGKKEEVGSTYYNIGVVSMAIPVEAARLAIEELGGPLTGEKMQKGFEMIKGFTAEGLMPELTLTASDHQGGGRGRISEWNGSEWTPISDWGAAYQDMVWDLVKESSAKFDVNA